VKTLEIVTDVFNRNRTDWWENFIEDLPQGRDTTQELWYEKRDAHLAKFGATLNYNSGQARLVFETEAACTAFLLRFS